MNEMYWITRLDSIQAAAIIFLIASGVLSALMFAAWLIEDDSDPESVYKRHLGKCLLFASISVLILLFVPSKKDMLMIYGVGGTIDYLKQNDTAKQLPDKCVQALDKIIDEYINKEEKDE